jgi:hypothetical protein
MILSSDVSLYVRCTHVEDNDGRHTFVVTADAFNSEVVRHEASASIQDLCRQFQITPNNLAYYERHSDGTLSRVTTGIDGGMMRVPMLDGRLESELLKTAKLPSTEAELMQRAMADLARASDPSDGQKASMHATSDTHWRLAHQEHKFLPPGSTQDAVLHVSSVWDASGKERPKFILEERPDSPVPSLQDAAARDECVRSLAETLSIDARTAEWFLRNQEGELGSISVTWERSTRENPHYTAWMRNDLNHLHKEEAKAAFPDQSVWEVRTAVVPVSQSQQKDLNAAFREAYIQRPVEDYLRQLGLSARDHDLLQENIGGRAIAEDYKQVSTSDSLVENEQQKIQER